MAISINGVPVTIVSEEEAERITSFVVCAPVGYFEDDVQTVCAMCATPIVHRPSVPMAAPKICIGCAVKTANAGEC